MTSERVRITVKSGETVIEIEGSEKYVEAKLKDPDSMDQLFSKVVKRKKADRQRSKRERTRTPKKKAGKRGGYQIVKDLDLSGRKNKISLKEFYKEKLPASNLESNAVFVYYLKKIGSTPSVTENHVYTCYKDVDERTPGNLHQSLLDTSHKKGWIETANMDDIAIPLVGENFVEHDLPHPEQSK